MGEAAENIEDVKEYKTVPTILAFHNSPAQIRCIVGPVGSGKTTGATWECCYYLPYFLLQHHKMRKTRGVIVRNTYDELIDTTQKTVFDWFPWGEYQSQRKIYTLRYPDGGPEVEILFRSCDNPKDVKKFKSLEITWYWIDESIEVSPDVKKMLRNRIGRFPKKSPVRFGIETTNPPDVDHSTYAEFPWFPECPGPVPEKKPKEGYAGFWQPPYENVANLRPGYYDDLRNDYSDSPDWVAMYIEGKPGILLQGKMVYNNYQRSIHVAKEPLVWAKGALFRGWDDSGNIPACIVGQVVGHGGVQILKEFCTDKMNIGDFAKWVNIECNTVFPGAKYIDYDDPAGHNEYSKREGGFTSNAEMIRDEIRVMPMASDQAFGARVGAVERALRIRDGLLIDPSCTRLINGFGGGYHYPEVGNTGIYREQPLKNRFSHIHDALQYIMIKILGSEPFVQHNYKDAQPEYIEVF